MSYPPLARRSPVASVRAFALNPLVIFLFVLIVALLAWKTTVQLGLIPANYPFASKTRGRLITINVVSALVALALAGGVGAACHFAFGRSERAANGGMLVVLLLFAGVFGYQMGNYLLNGPSPKATQTAQAGSNSALPAARDANATSDDPTVRGLQRMGDQIQRQNELINRPRPIPPSIPRPGSPSSQPLSPPASTPSSAPTSNPATPDTRPVPPPAREPENPAIATALDELTVEIEKQVDDLISQAEAIYAEAGKLPKRSIPELDKRAKAAQALARASNDLGQRFRAVDDEAKERLSKAGVAESDLMHHAIRYSIDKQFSLRAMSADGLARFAGKVQEEAEYLRDNFGRWQYDSAGKLTSKDPALKGRAVALRIHVESADRAKAQTLDGLKGK